MKYILYNQKSGHGTAKETAERLASNIGADASVVDITEIGNYSAFFDGISESDEVIICGGDGTINQFVNHTDGVDIKCRIYYFPTGTGNDFSVDIGHAEATEPYDITAYIQDLPSVTVNGKSYKFINGVGYGIDGYCCEVGDALKLKEKPVNYTSIAIKGLLFHYKPTAATVIVDGVEKTYKKVWIAPTMYGRHYGGGMIPTPDQKRGSDKLSLMIFHRSGKLKTLMIFPSLFKGEHVKHKKYIDVVSGNEITVKFDRPTALQIDGETILNVSEYTARI